MRVLVTGGNGQLGSELIAWYRSADGVLRTGDGHVLGTDRAELDITDRESVYRTVREFAPDVVINCAGWTAVDAAEDHEAAALAVNGIGPDHLARACAATGAWLVQISTDYVFSGEATSPYAEDAPPNPRSAYGRTKLVGEEAVREALPDAHYIVRTAWLYGHRGQNFVTTMLRLERERQTVDVVDDQVGQPTYARDLAAQIALLVDARPPAGTFHATNAGQVSWYGFTREIYRHIGADPTRVIPVTSEQFVRPAPRPAYSVLGHRKWEEFKIPVMRPWQDALEAALATWAQPH